MKKVAIKSLLFVLPVVLVVSCKPSLQVSTDYDRSVNFSSYKTFSLYYLLTNKNISELNEERIWNSIRSEMIKKGYKEDNYRPDLVVNAVSAINDKKYLSADFQRTGGIRPYGYWAGGTASGHGTVQAHQYKQGSLLIEVADGKTNRLIWEGTGNAEFEKKPKNPDEVISNAVNKILADFPESKF